MRKEKLARLPAKQAKLRERSAFMKTKEGRASLRARAKRALNKEINEHIKLVKRSMKIWEQEKTNKLRRKALKLIEE